MNNSEFMSQPHIQKIIENARKKVAIERGRSTVLANREQAPEPKRRSFLKALSVLGFAAISGAALLAGTSTADATVVFENVLFKSTIGTTNRTEAARWSDIKNLKDFGAVGNSVADDAAAIQAAVDYSTSPYATLQRGIVFVPPGSFKTTVPVTFNMNSVPSIVFQGCGYISQIIGNFADYVLKRDNALGPANGGCHIERLYVTNTHATGGCIELGSVVSASVRDCVLGGYRCLNLTASDGGSSQGVAVDAVSFSSGGLNNAVAIISGGNCTITNCDITGFRYGVVAYSLGCNIIGCRFEVNGGTAGGGDAGSAIAFGIIPAGPLSNSYSGRGMGAFSIIGCTFESNYTSIDIAGGTSGGLISACGFQQSHAGSTYGIRMRASLKQCTFSNLNVGVDVLNAAIEVAGGASGARSQITFENVIATNAGLNIAGVNGASADGVNPACVGTGSISGTTFTATTISSGAVAIGQTLNISGVAPETRIVRQITGSAGSTGTYEVTVSQTVAGPLTFRTAMYWDFSGVDCATGMNFVNCDIQPTWKFAQLPGPSFPGGIGRQIGDMVFITDGNQATIGGNVTAGGSANVGYVIWNGSNWTYRA